MTREGGEAAPWCGLFFPQINTPGLYVYRAKNCRVQGSWSSLEVLLLPKGKNVHPHFLRQKDRARRVAQEGGHDHLMTVFLSRWCLPKSHVAPVTPVTKIKKVGIAREQNFELRGVVSRIQSREGGVGGQGRGQGSGTHITNIIATKIQVREGGVGGQGRSKGSEIGRAHV